MDIPSEGLPNGQNSFHSTVLGQCSDAQHESISLYHIVPWLFNAQNAVTGGSNQYWVDGGGRKTRPGQCYGLRGTQRAQTTMLQAKSFGERRAEWRVTGLVFA